jgi:hypothetical protein
MRSLDPHVLNESVRIAMNETPNMSTFISHIPRRLGHDKAFDDAAECLFLGAIGLISRGDDHFLLKCRRGYDRALQSLQNSLADADRAKSVDTICATVMLGVFEVWMDHSNFFMYEMAKSSSRPYFAQARHLGFAIWRDYLSSLNCENLSPIPPTLNRRYFKPQWAAWYDPTFRFLSSATFSGGLFPFLFCFVQFAESLISNHPCFLDESAWQNVLSVDFATCSRKSRYDWDIRGIIPYLCKVPRLMMECRAILRNTERENNDEDTVARSLELRGTFLTLASTRKWDIHSLTTVLDTTYHNAGVKRCFFNRDDLNTANFCNHAMGMMMINRIIHALRAECSDLEEESQRLARLVINLHSRIENDNELRPLYRVLSLRVAHAVMSTETVWQPQPRDDAQWQQGSDGLTSKSGISLFAFNMYDRLLCGPSME